MWIVFDRQLDRFGQLAADNLGCEPQARSMPADTPAAVTISPDCTMRSLGSGLAPITRRTPILYRTRDKPLRRQAGSPKLTARGKRKTLIPLTLRLVASIVGVVTVTVIAYRVLPVNAATVGFAYLVLILLIASTWGLVESACASIVATLAFNFFFLPPVGTFTIADPQNWVALFSFLTTSLVASRLSTKAKQRARDAIDRQQDVERLYTFSRAILLIDASEPFPKQLALRLAETFECSGRCPV